MAFDPTRQHRLQGNWTRAWRKLLVVHLGTEPLQFGLLLLFAIAFGTLLVNIRGPLFNCFAMGSLFRLCFCARGRRRRGRDSKARLPPTPVGLSTNEERRRLLQPPNGSVHQRTESTNNDNNNNGEVPRNGTVVAGKSDPTQREKNSASVPAKKQLAPAFASPRRPHLADQSPPPPRRFASGGRTQVLPLTGQNRRRTPALMLLMAEQNSSYQQQRTPRSAGTPESRATMATTTTGKSCETIPEDPDESGAGRSMSDELLSIDRTFVSMPQQRSDFATATKRSGGCSPFPNPPPEFEIPAPAYSPPAPPKRAPEEEEEKTCCGNATTGSGMSSPDRSSYGGGGAQTPLNTTTGSSGDSLSQEGARAAAEIRISELESETGAPEWELLAAGGGPLQGTRVPRSISQQLELMAARH